MVAIVTASPCSSAPAITPSAIEEKYGSAMSCMTSPTESVRPRATAWAFGFGA